MDSFLIMVCTNCWDYIELKRVGSIELGLCPRCGSDAVGFSTDSYEALFSLTLKARSRTSLRGKSLKTVESLKKSVELVKQFGNDALLMMAGRGVRLSEASALLTRKKKEGGDLIDYVIEGEREALKRRYFAS